MKKVLSIFFGILLVLSFLLPIFPKVNKNETSAIITENEITNKKDIVSTKKEEMTSKLASIAKEGQTPFDSEAKKVMDGYSITPAVSSSLGFNQIENERYSITQFSMTSRESIYLWIYFPDGPLDNYYSLEIGFESQLGDKIYWHFTPYDLDKLFTGVISSPYGWKLLQLSYNDAIKSTNINDKTVFFSFYLTYKYISDDNPLDFVNNFTRYITNDTLTFYHIYLADKTSENTEISLETNYIYYSVKSSFSKDLENIYLNDSYKIKNKTEMFNYIYVGKNNLLLKTVNNNRYKWNISIKEQGKTKFDIYEGETYTFSTRGQTVINITVNEVRASRNSFPSYTTNVKIINYVNTITVTDYTFGYFNEGFMEISANNFYVLTFKLKSDYEINGEVNFKSTNEKMLIVKDILYNETSGEYRITVKGIKNGRCNVIASSSGRQIGKDKTIEVYSNSCTMEISGATNKDSEVKTLLLLVIAYVVLSLIFALITIKNIKKHKANQKNK